MTGRYRACSIRLVAALTILDFLGALLPKPRREPPADRPVRVLITNWGHLGDVVTILPLIRYLQGCSGIGKVDLLVGSWARVVVETTDLGVDIHVVDHWALDRSGRPWWDKAWRYFTSAAASIKGLRSASYDVSIDTYSMFPATHGLTWAAGIPCRIGFDSGGLGTLLTYRFSWSAEDSSLLDQQLGLFRPLLGTETPKALPACYPGYSPASLPKGVMRESHPVILHVGAGNPRKYWGKENWTELAVWLRQAGHTVIVTSGGGAETEVARTIATTAQVQSAAGQLSWHQLLTLVATSAAVVTHDTVVGHVAACFGTPTVVLTSGQLRLAYWRPNNPRVVVLSHPVGCYPCNRSGGCESMACIRQIEVGTVISGLRSALELPAPMPRDLARTP